MRNAHRVEAGTLVAWDGELTEVEERCLRCVDNVEMGQLKLYSIWQKTEYDSLAAKGCVVIGQAVDGVLWAGEKEADMNHETVSGSLVDHCERQRNGAYDEWICHLCGCLWPMTMYESYRPMCCAQNVGEVHD